VTRVGHGCFRRLHVVRLKRSFEREKGGGLLFADAALEHFRAEQAFFWQRRIMGSRV